MHVSLHLEEERKGLCLCIGILYQNAVLILDVSEYIDLELLRKVGQLPVSGISRIAAALPVHDVVRIKRREFSLRRDGEAHGARDCYRRLICHGPIIGHRADCIMGIFESELNFVFIRHFRPPN